jgi:hypothetical protein
VSSLKAGNFLPTLNPRVWNLTQDVSATIDCQIASQVSYSGVKWKQDKSDINHDTTNRNALSKFIANRIEIEVLRPLAQLIWDNAQDCTEELFKLVVNHFKSRLQAKLVKSYIVSTESSCITVLRFLQIDLKQTWCIITIQILCTYAHVLTGPDNDHYCPIIICQERIIICDYPWCENRTWRVVND